MLNYQIEAQNIFKELQDIYHYLHQHPELSYEEEHTGQWIADKLTEWGVAFENRGHTGIFAEIKGELPGPNLAFRADMDALPVLEKTGLPFASVHEGVMHACGHDAHMTILLGCIKLLQKRREKLKGSVSFIFQHAEERLGGARDFIEDLAEDYPEDLPSFDFVAAFHVWPQAVGTITCFGGPAMAQADAYRIDVTGLGGHGAAPHTTVNPIAPLAAMIPQIERIPGITLPVHESAIVNVCHFSAGERFNVVPTHGYLEGTIRTYDTVVREEVLNRLTDIAHHTAQAYGATGKFTLEPGCLAVINDIDTAKWAGETLSTHLTDVKIETSAFPSPLGEDFSEFQKLGPLLFMRLGIWSPQVDKQYALHNEHFQIDEKALVVGVAALFCLADTFDQEA